MRSLIAVIILLCSFGVAGAIDVGGKSGFGLVNIEGTGSGFDGQDSLTTQSDLLPMFAVRYDDYGSRNDQMDDLRQWLSRGLSISVAVNQGSVSAAEQESLLTIMGQYPGMVEIWNHGHNNINGTLYGGANSYDYSKMSVADWTTEIGPAQISLAYGVTPVGIVWPGDTGVRSNVKRYEYLVSALMRGWKYLAGLDVTGSADSTIVPICTPNAYNGTDTYDLTWAGPSWASMSASQRFWMWPAYGTLDLTQNTCVERYASGDGASPSWAPAGTTAWTLWTKTDQTVQSGHFTHCNAKFTWRHRYTTAVVSRSGMTIVLHEEDDTNAAAFTLNWGNNTGITVTDRWDTAYIAASCKALVDAGVIQWGTVGDRARWLASPPKSGLDLIGGAFVSPNVEIGDTNGVEMFALPGTMRSGWATGTNTSRFHEPGRRTLGFSSSAWTDTDHDGVVSDDGAASGQATYTYIRGGGPGGTSDAIEIDYTSQGTGAIQLTYADLRPGDYTLRVVAQGHSEVRTYDKVAVVARGWNQGVQNAIPFMDSVYEAWNLFSAYTAFDLDDSTEGTLGPGEAWLNVDYTFTIDAHPNAWTQYAPRSNWQYGAAIDLNFVVDVASKRFRIGDIQLIWEAP